MNELSPVTDAPRVVEIHAVGLKDTPESLCQAAEHEHMRAALLRNRKAVDELWRGETDPVLKERLGAISTDLYSSWLFRRWPCPVCAQPCERTVIMTFTGPNFAVYHCEACEPIRQETL